jgi:rubrerythrin
MNNLDKEFTHRWWEKLLADEDKMTLWLQKLQRTELDGYTGNLEAEALWAKDNLAAKAVLVGIAHDELRHSDLLVDLLRQRGLEPNEESPESFYWSEMDKIIIDLSSCAAVFHLGEQLAADRFRVLFDHPDTPDDIRSFIASAMPDEEYHARSFRKLTDDITLERILVHHVETINVLKGM